MLEIYRSLVIFLLLLVDVAKAEPSVVVPFININCVLVAFSRLVEVLVLYVLMTAQGMSISVMGIQLDGTTEKLQSSLVLFLKGVAVAQYTPSLRGE